MKGEAWDGGYWQRYGARRLTRRRLIQGTVVGGAGLAAAAAVGCGDGNGGSSATGTASKTESPQRGGAATIFYYGESPNYDPHRTNTGSVAAGGFLFERLFRVDPDKLDLQPNIVTKWEYADPTTLILHIREGVKFFDKPPANGRLMTAEDVAYSLNRARTPAPLNTNYPRYEKIDAVEAPDAKTVRVKTKAPSAALLTFISGETVMNRESIEAIGDTIKDPRQAISVGPFFCTDFKAGTSGKLVRNPNYWDAGKPYLDGIDWVQIVDPAAQVAALRTGDVDFTAGSTALDADQKKQLERSNPSMVFYRLSAAYPAMFLTNNEKPPFNDIRVRQAVDLVTNRQQLVSVVRPDASAPTGPLWEGFLASWAIPDKELLARPGYRQPKDQDIAEAKKLLAAAGYEKGLDLPADGSEFNPAMNLDSVPASVDQFAKAGIKLHLDRILDRATFLDTAAKGEALFRSNAVSAAVEPGEQLRFRYHSKASRNYQRYRSAEVDGMIDKQDEILNTAERKDMILKAQRKILDDVAIVHILWPWVFIAVQPWLRGLRPSVFTQSGDPADWWRAKT